ncbi:branched-chain amino acid ABC transporter permease [Paenibacillus xerothermodurans]|uniref:Branched-chain amino acid ABC transporter permease n=1 Tax=Paenibacillus xerothermodurans TaxID=1977292 RepID=A0A2W1NPG6_PAEXE|nr:branched-chain amino acid ABC transporter permease [Paenibacillus xerothermodurans]PZE21385.1 branched-chain amino acid ABC transporter permease [Paenibacillus xerothermodurans]
MLYDILVSGVAVGSIYSLIAMAFSLIFRSTGYLNIAQGEMVMLGSLVGYTMLVSLGFNYYASLMITMMIAGVLGLLTNQLIFIPIQNRGGHDLHILIASIGLLIMLPQVAGLIWGTKTLSYPNNISQNQLALGDIQISGLNFLIIVIAFIIMIALQCFFRFTRVGQAMRAIADDKVMSQLVGVNIKKYITLIFMVAGGLAGAAGALFGPVYFASYDIGTIGIKGFAAAVVGGFGSVSGGMLGGIMIGLIEGFSGTMISSTYRDMILYGILILVLLIRPTGIFGIKQRRDAA